MAQGQTKKANNILTGSLHFLSSTISFIFTQSTRGKSGPAAALANAGTVISLIDPESCRRTGLRVILGPAKYARKWL